MKHAHLVTSAGTTIAPVYKTVLALGSEGEFEELYISESKGKTILYKKDQLQVPLDEIVTVLCSKIGDYVADRAFNFSSLNGSEVPRLRVNIAESLATQRPDIFAPEELAQFENYIYKTSGDFSKRTLRRMSRCLDELLSAEGIHFDASTYRGWIKGNVLHPEDLESAELLGIILDNEELYERAHSIKTTPKGDNPYFRMVDAHRQISHDLAPAKGQGSGTTTHRDAPPGRVYAALSTWRKIVVDTLKPLFGEGYVPVTVHDIRLFEDEKKETNQVSTGISKGAVIIESDEEQRAETYKTLGITAPRKRSASTLEWIGRSFEHFEALMHAYAQSPLAQEKTRERNMDVVSMDEMLIDGTKLYYPKMTEIRFVSPLFDYSSKNLVMCYTQFHERLGPKVNDAKFRRKLIRELNHDLPPEHPFYTVYDAFYQSSLFMQSLYSRKDLFRRLSSFLRASDIIFLNQLSRIPPQERVPIIEESKNANIKLGETLAEFEITYRTEIAQLRASDSHVPQEITIFRSHPAASTQLHISIPIERTELPTLYEVLTRFGVAPADYMALQAGMERRVAEEFNKKIKTPDRVIDLSGMHELSMRR